MNSTLQELTDKIYVEGVEKGKTDAAALLSKAQDDAAAIRKKAEDDAAAIMEQAKRQAQELDKNTRSELQLFGNQSVEALKTEVTNLITGKIAGDSVKAATADKDFMQKLMLTFAQEWAKKEQLTIDAKDADALTAYFAANAKDLLNKGVTINSVNNLKTEFSVQPASGGYKIAFGEAEFVEYFKEFLRPKLVELLFGK